MICDPERLACTGREKDACLETMRKLARLWAEVCRDGILVVLTLAETEEDPFFRACLLEVGEGYEPAELERLFAAYLAAGNYRGGAFLNAALAAKGLMLLSELSQEGSGISPAAWGRRLSSELRGFFGAEYRDRVIAAVEEETRNRTRREKSIVPAFDRLAGLSRARLRELVQSAGVRTLAIALQGAGAEVEDALLESLDEEKRGLVEQDRPLLTNLREKDVEDAQTKLLGMKGAF